MTSKHEHPAILRPADYCRYSLDAIEDARARRKRRKRDTGPDMIGMDIKCELLRRAIEDAPEPDQFESWLLQQVIQSPASGPVRAMAHEILADYQNAAAVQRFQEWLQDGAPSPRFDQAQRAETATKRKTTRG